MAKKILRASGFTLVELLVVIAIIGILSTILLADYKKGESSKRVNLSRDSLLSALRLAQNYSLSGKQIPQPAAAPQIRGPARYSCSASNSAASYWVEFTASNNFDIMGEDTCGAIMRIQSLSIVGQTRFLQVNPYRVVTPDGTIDATSLALRFSPPFGNITAATVSSPQKPDFAIFTWVSLGIEYQDGSYPKSIRVDGISGKME